MTGCSVFSRTLPWGIALTLLAAGCGKPLTLDEAEVDMRLDRVDETVPYCTSSGGDAAMRVLADQVDGAMRLGAYVGDDAVDGQGVSHAASGSCGGTVESSFEHANGDNDYVITFSDYCVGSGGEQLVVDGTLEALEDGTPSDDGPIIASLEVRSDGPFALTQDGETVEVDLAGVRVDYGKPAAWAPDAPDADDPDTITLTEMTMHYPDADGRTDFIRGVTVERVDGAAPEFTVVGGQVGTEGEGQVSVRTAADDPMVVDLTSLSVTGGTLELSGAGGTELTLTPGGTTGVIELTLDGEAFDRDVDCSAARGAITEIGLALLLELPIH